MQTRPHRIFAGLFAVERDTVSVTHLARVNRDFKLFYGYNVC
jgi:hypothetical protein